MNTCGNLIGIVDKAQTFLNQIITGDITWLSVYNPQLKQQTVPWKSPSSPRKKKQ
jgi:hypothetical protein